MDRETCKHATSRHHDKCCAAGVVYRDVVPDPEETMGIAFRYPCQIIEGAAYESLNEGQKENYDRRGTCDKFELPTSQEIEESDRQAQAEFDKIVAVIPVCERIKAEHKGSSWVGTVECPVCGGVLRMSHAAINGHIHAACETENCVRFME